MELNILTYQGKHKLPPTVWFPLQLKFLFQISRIWEKYVAQPSPLAVGVSEKGIYISGDGNQPALDGAGKYAQKPHAEVLGHFHKAKASYKSFLSLPVPPLAG